VRYEREVEEKKNTRINPGGTKQIETLPERSEKKKDFQGKKAQTGGTSPGGEKRVISAKKGKDALGATSWTCSTSDNEKKEPGKTLSLGAENEKKRPRGVVQKNLRDHAHQIYLKGRQDRTAETSIGLTNLANIS